MAALFQELGTLIAKLNSTRNNLTDPKRQEELQKLIRVLTAIFQELVAESLDENAQAYVEALHAVKNAQATADAGLKGIKTVEAVIADATEAAKVADKVIGLFAKVFA